MRLMKRWAVVVGVVTAGTLGMAAPSLAATNSTSAHQCQKGGWQHLERSDGSLFADQDECVSYGAGGGSLWPIPVGHPAVEFIDVVPVGTTGTEFTSGYAVSGFPADTLVLFTVSGPEHQGTLELTTDASGDATVPYTDVVGYCAAPYGPVTITATDGNVTVSATSSPDFCVAP